MKGTFKKTVSIEMLCATVIAGLVYGVLGNFVYSHVIGNVSRPLFVGCYFALLALVLATVVWLVSVRKLTCEAGAKEAGIAAALIIGLLLLGCLFEFLYELVPVAKLEEADSYVLLLDQSSSMKTSDSEKKRNDAIAALLAEKGADFPYAVYTFSDTVVFERDMRPKAEGIWELTAEDSGGTALYSALTTALTDMQNGKLTKGQATRIILLSDGVPTDHGSVNQIASTCGAEGVTISTVGLGSGLNKQLMTRLAQKTGGIYVQVDDVMQLGEAMKKASAGIQERNLLGFRTWTNREVLLGVMRVLFLLILALIIGYIKYLFLDMTSIPQIVISAVATVLAALIMEIGINQFYLDENWMRLSACILISAQLAYKRVYIRGFGRNAGPEMAPDIAADGEPSELRNGNMGSLPETGTLGYGSGRNSE